MPRFFPPHLMVLVTLLIVVVWFMLLHYFRQSTSLQRYISELLGENTPQNSLRNFQLAKQRLEEHLNRDALDDPLRQEIELALGLESEEHGHQRPGFREGSRDEYSVSKRA